MSHHRLLLGIVLAGLVLRLASALYQGDTVAPLPGIYDQIYYDALSRRVLAGYGFSFSTDTWPGTLAGEPTAHWSFLYTLYMVGVYWLFGPHPLAARLIQVLVAGILHPWLVWRIGARAFSPRVGLVAAALTSVYAYFIYYNAALMTESFYILAVLWTLDVAMEMRQRSSLDPGRSIRWRGGFRRWRPWVMLGLALGVAALLRQAILLFVPFLLAWLWRSTKTVPQLAPPARGVMACLAVMAVLIVPWTVRNYLALGHFVPLNTNVGYAFFWANHPIHGTSFMSILPANGPSYADLIPQELRGLDEAAINQALLREGLRFVLEDPVRYALLSLNRVKDYFKFWPSTESGLISNVARTLSFGLYLPFMVLGLGLSIPRFLRHDAATRGPEEHDVPTAAVGVLYLFTVVYSLIHLLSWALIRYRLPVDAVLIVFAAAGAVSLANWFSLRYAVKKAPRGTGWS